MQNILTFFSSRNQIDKLKHSLLLVGDEITCIDKEAVIFIAKVTSFNPLSLL